MDILYSFMLFLMSIGNFNENTNLNQELQNYDVIISTDIDGKSKITFKAKEGATLG